MISIYPHIIGIGVIPGVIVDFGVKLILIVGTIGKSNFKMSF
jgi:hypothetical protein